MEQLLHYVWKHKMFPLKTLLTSDGKEVEVIDPGMHNSNSGPDFFNAKVKIGEVMWIGNVEIHNRSTDWFRHHHDSNSDYNNVVLHVVGEIDGEVIGVDGMPIPQLKLEIPSAVSDNYHELLHTDRFPPCYKVVTQLSTLMLHSWMAVLQTERLEEKAEAIMRRVEMMGGDWEQAFFITLARNFGFGINGDAFEEWGKSIPLNIAGRHRDDTFQCEALFMGQAGLLQTDNLPASWREKAQGDDYFLRLAKEYEFLKHKYALTANTFGMWRFLRLRPQNFPHIRIAQMVTLYCAQQLNLSKLVACTSLDEVIRLLQTKVTTYWQTHYSFGEVSELNEKHLSQQSLQLLIINTAVPILFAYGRHQMREELCERALIFLDGLKAENNHIVRMWKDCGMTVTTAGDSQALIQLKRKYCDKHDCLRCRIGHCYLKRAVDGDVSR